jgi:hypothetical protein
MMNFNPSTFTCSLESFIFMLPQYIIGHDGCLYGIGFIIWELSPNGDKKYAEFLWCKYSLLYLRYGI